MTLNDYKQELKETATALSKSGKGILAVDESTKTIGERLASINVENTEENRKVYRGLLFTSEGLGGIYKWCNSIRRDFISGPYRWRVYGQKTSEIRHYSRHQI